jgi:hypothetical protein
MFLIESVSNTVYFGLSEKESKLEYLIYKGNSKYSGKGVNLDLIGLKKFIKDYDMEKYVKYYTKVPLSSFKVLEHIDKDEKYNMITVQIPFKFKITNVNKL